jgi:rhamnogalacturonyl hydrolase YesR
MKSGTLRVSLPALAAAVSLCAAAQLSDAWDPATVASNGCRVADWMIAHPMRANHRDWSYGAFYAGLAAFGLSDPSLPYLDVVRERGAGCSWKPDDRLYSANAHCIAQAWLEIARADDNPAALAPFRATCDFILGARVRSPLVWRVGASRRFALNLERWSWCDALFMAPPAWARLAAMTGDDRYRDFMISEYRATHARLYDRDERLFYRDANFADRKTSGGVRTFWGRGMGWVLAGLPLVMRELPDDLRTRPWFEGLFKEMCEKVKTLQRSDGAWGPNLLDQKNPDLPEMSGTAFFCYAFMWGVNNGLLDEADYLPRVKRAWAAMCRSVDGEGRLGWVQPVGERPERGFGADSTETYAAGGFLLAASEIRKHATLAGHRGAKRVRVAPVARYRVDTVEVPWRALGLPERDLVVFDVRDGASLPYQLWDDDGDGAPDKLIFSSTFVAGVSREFRVFNDSSLKRPDLSAACYGRHAPDRLDDYLWENDKAAWRIYGPAVSQPPPKGEGLVSSGVDVWSKKVGRPVIDKWLKIGKYHKDVGEGMDAYKVGTSCGAGGFAVWSGGRAFSAGNWRTQRRIATGPVRAAFEVTYAPFDCGGGVKVEERLVVSVDRGRRFSKMSATFRITGAKEVRGGPGVNASAKKDHAGELTARPDAGWIANFEPKMKDGTSILTAIFTPGPAELQTTGEGDVLLVRTVSDGKPFVWWIGQGWTGRGEVLDPRQWAECVARERDVAFNPISVELH